MAMAVPLLESPPLIKGVTWGGGGGIKFFGIKGDKPVKVRFM